jgi:hypothetical protein
MKIEIRKAATPAGRTSVTPLTAGDLSKIEGGQQLLAHELVHVIQQH